MKEHLIGALTQLIVLCVLDCILIDGLRKSSNDKRFKLENGSCCVYSEGQPGITHQSRTPTAMYETLTI